MQQGRRSDRLCHRKGVNAVGMADVGRSESRAAWPMNSRGWFQHFTGCLCPADSMTGGGRRIDAGLRRKPGLPVGAGRAEGGDGSMVR